MLYVDTTLDMIEQAIRDGAALGVLKNSITNGASNPVGKLGEQIVHAAYGGKYVDTRDYDIILPDGRTAEVKTKQRIHAPKPWFDCTVAAFNTRQQCDVYVFVTVLKDLSEGWVCGWYPKADFYKDARFWKKDEPDPRNGWACKADSYSIEVQNLRPAETLCGEWDSRFASSRWPDAWRTSGTIRPSNAPALSVSTPRKVATSFR